jgi:hypothetical protein
MSRPAATKATDESHEALAGLHEANGLRRLTCSRSRSARIEDGRTEDDGSVEPSLNVAEHELDDIACYLLDDNVPRNDRPEVKDNARRRGRPRAPSDRKPPVITH